MMEYRLVIGFAQFLFGEHVRRRAPQGRRHGLCLRLGDGTFCQSDVFLT